MTLAALEGTLMDYLLGKSALKNIPVVRDLLTTKEEIKDRALQFMNELQKKPLHIQFGLLRMRAR